MTEPTSAQIEIAKAMTENQLQDNILDAAHKYKWRVHAERPAVNQSGKWATPIQGDPGFPDLVLARNGIEWKFELKSEKGKLTVEQREWYHALPNCLIIRPRNWLSGEVEALLR